MQDAPDSSVQVRPGFALVVFGAGAAVFALALRFQAELPFARLCLFAWFLSLAFLSVRGLWNKPKDALARIDQRIANSAVALLGVVGVAAMILEGSGPGIGLITLGFLWAFASDFWGDKLQRASGKLGFDPTDLVQTRKIQIQAITQAILVALVLISIVIQIVFF